ncbi:MAG: hypothetical protein ACRDCB_10385, partial [Clostridium sp.]
MKYIIKNTLNNKLVNFLLVVQLVLGLTAIYNSINISERLNSEINRFDRVFNNGKVYKIRNEYFNQSETIKSADLEKLNKAIDNIDSSKNIEYPYSFNIAIYNKSFENSSLFEATPDKLEVNNKDFFRSYSIFMNDLAKEKANLEIQEGSWFLEEESNSIPVVLGYDYSEYFHVNDEFEFIDFENDKVLRKAKIIGFLKKGSEISANLELPLDLRDINLDKYIIFNNKELINNKNSILSLLFNNYIYFNQNTNLDDIEIESNKIIKDFKDANLPVYLSFEGKELENNIEDLKSSKELSILTSIIITIFLSITIILTLLNSVIKRTKEFGVHILNGATIKKMMYFILGEVLILIGIAFLI